MIAILKKRFYNLKSIERVVALFSSILVFVWFFNLYMNRVDTTPAEQGYIDAITERINKVTSDPTLLLNGPGNITIKKDVITYKIENAECKATATYDKDYKLIEYTIEDAYTPIGTAVLTALFGAFILSLFTYFIFAFLMSALCGLYLLTFKDHLYE